MDKNIADEIARALAEYTDDVADGLKQATDEVSKKAVSELKRSSPRETGDYAKGWARKKTATGYVVHNRTNYQLTHLLEHGHMNRNGSRTPAHPHIKQVEKRVINTMAKRSEEVVQK